MKDLVVVKIFNTRLEAQIAKGFLQANKITAFVTADDEASASPFPMAVDPSGVKLYVAEKDSKKADELLKKYNDK